MITDVGLDMIAQAMRDGSSIEIKYIALGSGTTVPAATDTALVTEQFRKVVTQQLANGTGDTKTICYIAPYEATSDMFTIQEIGAFAGPEASDTPGSGVMVARWLYNRAKTDLESLQISIDDIIGRGV